MHRATCRREVHCTRNLPSSNMVLFILLQSPPLTLYSLLAPISTHRSFYAAPSTLRRKRKRTRTTTAISDPNPIPTPPLPEIAQHITTGINSTTVHLEKSVCFRRLKPSSPTAPQPTTKSPNTLALIFLPTPPSTSPPLQFEHLPTLAHLSSEEPALIIPLPATAEKEIAAAVGLPRVSALGVMADAPGAEALIELCRRKVKPMGLGWVKDAVRGQWRGVKVVGQAG